MLAGLAMAYKGARLAYDGVDPDVTSFALLLFSAAAASVALLFAPPRPRAARVAIALSAVAGLGGALAVSWYLLFGPFGSEEPAPFQAGIAVANFGSLLGLLVVGWSCGRRRMLPGPAAWLPFATGALTMPLIAVGFSWPDEGLILPGLLWATLGAAIAVTGAKRVEG